MCVCKLNGVKKRIEAELSRIKRNKEEYDLDKSKYYDSDSCIATLETVLYEFIENAN